MLGKNEFIKEIKTLNRVFGPRALYLAVTLDTKPEVQKHDKESLFPYVHVPF